MSTSASNAELVGADNTLVDISPRPTGTIMDDAESSQTILFEDHQGENYVWPFELCRTYEVFMTRQCFITALNETRQSNH